MVSQSLSESLSLVEMELEVEIHARESETRDERLLELSLFRDDASESLKSKARDGRLLALPSLSRVDASESLSEE